MNNYEIDALSRKMIVENTDINLFVEAGAGSGKTTMLVSRMVAMVESGKDISKISAITFTKPAALEFYARFQELLSNRSKYPNEYKPKFDGDLPEVTKLSAKRCEEALNNIDLCFMGTLDSFCNMVLSEHPYAAKIPSGATIATNEELKRLYKNEYLKIINGTNKDLKNKAQTFADFHDFPLDVFSEGMSSIMPLRNVDLIFKKPSFFDIDKELKEQKKSISQMIDAVLNLEDYGKQSKESLLALEALRNNSSLLKGEWNNKLNSVIKALKKLEKLRIPVSAAEANIEHLTFFKENEKSGKWFNFNTDDIYYPYSYLNELKYQVTLDFLVSSKEFVANSLRQLGKLSFTDYLIYLRDLLKEDNTNDRKLIKHIYDRHRYFLIDEFQDTNPIQAEIFFYLTAKKSKENWFDCIPYPGSLFIVGDPKQSIYRFRQADVEAFLRIKKIFEKPEVGRAIYLKKNFRSSRNIREYFNRVFSNILVESNVQSGYEEIPITEDEYDESSLLTGVFKYHFDSKRNPESQEMDENKVKTIIERLVNSEYLIKAKHDKSLRKITYSDFMVITPTKGSLKNFMSAFKNADIPFKVEGDVEFASNEALICVVNIYNYLVNKTNISKYKVYRSSIFNIPESAIYMNDQSVLNYVDNLLLEVNEELNYLKPSSMFKLILDRFDILNKVNDDNLEYLFYTLELIRSKEGSLEINTHKEAVDFINEQIIGNDKEIERSISLTDDADVVWLANLHKVKGLQKPIVILTGKTSSKAPSLRIEQGYNGFNGYIFSLNNIISSKENIDKQEDEKLSLEAEKDRLRYVAATRAESVLIVASHDGGETTRMWDSLIEEDTKDIFAAVLIKNENVNKPDFRKVIFDDNKIVFEIKEPSFTYKTPSTIKSDSIGINIEERTTSSDATIKGTMIHKLMEVIVLSKNRTNKEELINYIINEYSEEDNEKYRKILSNVYDVITSGGYEQKSNTPKDILNVLLNADEVYTEVPFTLKIKEGVLTGIMDVVYLKDNLWHILDYKTNYCDDNLEEKYKPQLEAYKLAFKEIEGEDAVTEIYHINVKEL